MLPLKVSLIQAPLVWHDPAANRNYFADQIRQAAEADLWVLPEMFTTGFSMAADKIAEPMDGPTVNWMRDTASKRATHLMGSLAIEENGQYYNRLVVAKPSGELLWYNKRHLFKMAGEHHAYAAGTERVVVSINGWKICLQVCYDLRFPVFSRNHQKPAYDLLVYVANWPQARIFAWDHLLIARAIENQSYVVGVNRIGTDQNELRYVGHSCIIDPMGKMLVNAQENEGVYSAQLDKDYLIDIRQKLPFLQDADSFDIRLD